MPLTCPNDCLMRITWWHDHTGDARQVSVGLVESDTWDLLVECTEQLGPFDDPMDGLREATAKALAARDRQMVGQQLLDV